MRRHVVVPDVMMDELEVPDSLTGANVHTDKAVRKEISARPMSAVRVVGCGLHVQVDITKFCIDGERPPDAGVAGVFGRPSLPRVVTELALARNCVEGPLLLTGPNIE